MSEPFLEPLLSAFSATDPGELESLRRIRALAAKGPGVLARSHFEPGHLTASAVVVNPARTHTCLIHHVQLGLWLQPGGHFEPGELDPRQAAAREAREETGLTLLNAEDAPLLDVDVHAIPARTKGARIEPAHEHFDLRFCFEAEGEPEAGEGTSACRWIPLADLDPGLDASLLRALRKVAQGSD